MDPAAVANTRWPTVGQTFVCAFYVVTSMSWHQEFDGSLLFCSPLGALFHSLSSLFHSISSPTQVDCYFLRLIVGISPAVLVVTVASGASKCASKMEKNHLTSPSACLI